MQIFLSRQRFHWRTLLALLALGVAAQHGHAAHSALWGTAGEKWSPQGRLPDFSFAGYHRGEKPLPSVGGGRSVKDFGAKGDGVADDSDAFLRAIQAVTSGVIVVPPGRYKITKILEISRPGVVLKGAGPGKSILFFPVPLQQLKPNMGATTTGQPTSNYSWSGGLVSLKGDYRSRTLAQVTQPARRGDFVVTVSSAAAMKPGQSIEIAQRDEPGNSLAVQLYGGDAGSTTKLKGATRASLVARVVAVENNSVRLDRALRFNVQPEWKPEARSFEPTVTESGVEGFTFEFPVTPYGGHFSEQGFNPVALTRTVNCWVRNLLIKNADSGFFVSGRFNTVCDVAFESERKPDKTGYTGHHGIYCSDDDNLYTRFDYRTKFIHDITVSHCAGNCITHGKGLDLSLDHHKRTPYANLFSDLDVGAGTRPWMCGGGADLGKHTGAQETFWNLRAARSISYPPAAFGPAGMNLVGVFTSQPGETNPTGKWFEVIPPASLVPQDLHQAQLARRLKK